MSEQQPERKLNAKEKRFVAEYLVDAKFNQTQAYIRAGYSENGARQNASRLMAKDYIQEAIAHAREEMDKEYQHRVMQKYEVLAELTEIARKSDIGELLVDENGEVIQDLNSISVKQAKKQNKSKFIKKAKITTTKDIGINEQGEPVETVTTTAEIEMYSRHEALRDLGKHYALFVDRTDLTSGGDKLAAPIIYLPEVDQNADE